MTHLKLDYKTEYVNLIIWENALQYYMNYLNMTPPYQGNLP